MTETRSRIRARASTVAACGLAALCGQGATAVAQSRLWRPDERVLVTDFSYVNAVAASSFTVFAATPRGLLVYDRTARRWGLPVTALDGYPTSRVLVALADVTGDAVWLGLTDGYARYDAATRIWERAPLGGAVTDLMMDSADPAAGIWALAGGRWVQVSRFGGPVLGGGVLPPVTRRLRSLDVESALRAAPLADAMRALVFDDPRLRARHFTAAARSPDRPELFLGTDGGGLVQIDPGMGMWESLPYGLPGPRAGALAAGPDGVWVAAGGSGGRSGVAWVAADLSSVESRRGGSQATAGIEFYEARDMVASGAALWLASDRGLYRVEAGSLTGREVAPRDEVWCVAAAPSGAWVGTAHGVARVTDAGATVYAGPTVLSLWSFHDTIWVGTTAGLHVLVPGSSGLAQASAARATPTLGGAIVALAQAGDTLVAATPDLLAWREPVSGVWTVLRPTAPLGRLTHLALDPEGVWVAGTEGLAHWTIPASRFVAVRVPGDLPDLVRAVVASGRYVWVATDAGLVRFDRGALLGP